MSKFYNSQGWRDRAAVLAGIFGLSSLLILPVLAQSNRESQSTFQPSSVLDSPQRSGGNIADTLKRESEFQTLASVLAVAGLTDMLRQEGRPLTIFAPTNQAFRKNAAVYNQLLQPQNKEKLARVLKYHLIAGSVTAEDVNKGEIKTVEGGTVKIRVAPDGVIMNDNVKGVQPSIEAKNGVIVRVDNLLLPPDL
ncbi:fasciclin domain-containing protein [Microcoleus vaginatus DQ-U2]|uniref:fasciclin domain-containing protein n=1 Tax=Microcoleus vaginatus TaxID=119532 RepID=UPI00168858B2|nr:fasciclin domain-containing protein [Microcoleus sp. FACHB-DQ6]